MTWRAGGSTLQIDGTKTDTERGGEERRTRSRLGIKMVTWEREREIGT